MWVIAWQAVQVIPACELDLSQDRSSDRRTPRSRTAPHRDNRRTSAMPSRFHPASSETWLVSDAEQVGLVVKRTEMMRAMKPALISVLMALQTVIVHHQGARRNEIARSGAGGGRMKILVPSPGPAWLFARIMCMKCYHRRNGHSHRAHPKPTRHLIRGPRQPMQDVKPNCQ